MKIQVQICLVGRSYSHHFAHRDLGVRDRLTKQEELLNSKVQVAIFIEWFCGSHFSFSVENINMGVLWTKVWCCEAFLGQHLISECSGNGDWVHQNQGLAAAWAQALGGHEGGAQGEGRLHHCHLSVSWPWVRGNKQTMQVETDKLMDKNFKKEFPGLGFHQVHFVVTWLLKKI